MNDLQKIARSTRRNLFGVSGWLDDFKLQWEDAITNFQAWRAALDDAESRLYEIYDRIKDDPDDLAEWHRLFDQVNAKKSAMDAVAGLVTQVSEWWASFRSSVGLSGRSGLFGSMGIALPAFPITLGALLALIAGATAAVNATYAFIAYVNAKTSRFAQLVSAGVEPIQASREATEAAIRESNYSFGARIERSIFWIVIGTGIFLLLGSWRSHEK